ncbi:MAG: hypothetical protein AAGA76_14665, partial [Pseudomonadota bacterium]
HGFPVDLRKSCSLSKQQLLMPEIFCLRVLRQEKCMSDRIKITHDQMVAEGRFTIAALVFAVLFSTVFFWISLPFSWLQNLLAFWWLPLIAIKAIRKLLVPGF